MNRLIGLKALVISAGLVMASSVQAQSVGLDLAVSDETANFGAFMETQTPVDSTRYAAHYFYNEPGDKLISASMRVERKGMVGSPNFDFGIKGKAYGFTQDRFDADGFGLMLGVTARYWLDTRSPASVSMEAMVSPQIVTSGDLNRARELAVRADMQILPTVNGFVGFRYLMLDLDQRSDYEMDKNAHIGVELKLN